MLSPLKQTHHKIKLFNLPLFIRKKKKTKLKNCSLLLLLFWQFSNENFRVKVVGCTTRDCVYWFLTPSSIRTCVSQPPRFLSSFTFLGCHVAPSGPREVWFKTLPDPRRRCMWCNLPSSQFYLCFMLFGYKKKTKSASRVLPIASQHISLNCSSLLICVIRW